MTKQLQQHVTLKGTKEGLQLQLDDQCTFEVLLKEVEDKLSEQKEQLTSPKGERLQVKVDAGYRYLKEGQQEALTAMLQDTFHIDVAEVRSNVISRTQAEAARKEDHVIRMARVIRSGQVLELEGDVLIVGDINPGAVVKTTGSIFVLGSLKGVAHAGCNGNVRAVICASFMDPAQLRIAHIVRHPPEEEEWRGMFESAFVNDEGTLVLERGQKLGFFRPELAEDDD
ncbi:septum site-determining protein MinC [Alkalicoccus daliensis]|uniref:Probable septum site-determining protein MinC n=1 Tax=Alkalicoccus daliensis TaxID=745820 RepID=A0A1H0CMZ6_9BACI|nr:septum site-determining protein MinC [Alkalicoccus daliensis]SDN59260.1 septum site-determining protein MinC [Alkalicoccus daliensis]